MICLRALAVLVFFLTGCTRSSPTISPPAESPSAPPPQPVSLRVATYNTNWGNRHLRAVVTTIQDADADLVCLQETTPALERLLKDMLGERYSHIRFFGHDGRYRAERFGLLSKHPLENAAFHPPQHGLFGTLVGEVNVEGRTLQVANVHLKPFIVRRGAGIAGAYSALTRTDAVHAQEIEYVLDKLKPDMPTIIAGDFNSPSPLKAPELLRKEGFIDSFAAVHDQPDNTPTWRWDFRHASLALRIDYIFHSEHFKTQRSRVVESEGSDHFLATSLLELKPRAKIGASANRKTQHR